MFVYVCESKCQGTCEDDANSINLKLFPQYPEPPHVQDYQVPIAMLDFTSVMDKYWDITMRRIIPFIDGVHYVKKIADLADVNIALVRMAVQHLLYYGCVKLIDIFEFSNIYNVTAEIRHFLTSDSIKTECVQFVRNIESKKDVSFGDVFSLYCSMKGGLRVVDWIQDNQEALQLVDIRKFVAFGVLKGFLYRVHKYPLLSSASDGIHADPVLGRIAKLLNGRTHMDDLCCRFYLNYIELESRLSSFGVQFIVK